MWYPDALDVRNTAASLVPAPAPSPGDTASHWSTVYTGPYTIDLARGLVVYPKTIDATVAAELPFMATEEILMAAVRAGGDRQELHESIRRHSLAAAEQVKMHGKSNDLMDSLKSDPAFAKVNLASVLDAGKFVGRAPEQTESFVKNVVEPIRARYRSELGQQVTLKV